MHKLTVCLVIIVLTLLGQPAWSADLQTPPSADDVVLAEELEPRALLYLIRQSFDVLDTQGVKDTLADDAGILRAEPPSAEAKEALSKALIAEGSYYITSLRYLIAVGGSNWPQDLPAASYDAKYNLRLGILQDSWISAAQGLAGADMRAIMTEVDMINALTEGYLSIPAELDHFGSLDELVAGAIETPVETSALQL